MQGGRFPVVVVGYTVTASCLYRVDVFKITVCLFIPFSFVILWQDQLMSPIQLTTNHISSPGPMPGETSRTGSGGSGNGPYVQDYMTLFPGQVEPSGQAVASSVSQPLSHDSLGQCLPGQDLASPSPIVASALDDTSELVPSAITHTASSTVTPTDAAATFSHGSDYTSISSQAPPPASQLQSMAALPVTQTFALPRPFQASGAKNRPVQRIAPANTLPPPHVILAGLFLILR